MTAVASDSRRVALVTGAGAGIGVARYGRLDVLVNNAGIGDGAVPALDQTAERFRRTLSVHVEGCFLMSRAAARVMIAPHSGSRGGAIINLSSIAGHVAIPNRIGYAAAKGAIRVMTKVLACEWAASGIRVNAVAPGYVRTELGRVDKRDSQGGLIVIQAGICDGDQLGTRPDVGRGMGISRALHSGRPRPERAQTREPPPCSGLDFLDRADGLGGFKLQVQRLI